MKRSALLFCLFTALTFSITSCNKDDDDTQVEICGNGIDDDGDGFIDLDDNDCTERGATECNNGIDDDGDGFVDGNDFDCQETGTNCANGIDDDGNGFTDCDDLACAGMAGC